jgi:hypothetical protein
MGGTTMLDKVRSFLSRLFPPELAAYVPGSKLVTGVILAVAASLGIGADATVELPLTGDVDLSTLALAIGVYLFPTKES